MLAIRPITNTGVMDFDSSLSYQYPLCQYWIDILRPMFDFYSMVEYVKLGVQFVPAFNCGETNNSLTSYQVVTTHEPDGFVGLDDLSGYSKCQTFTLQ